MLQATIQKNDVKARWIIWIFSVTVFCAVVLLGNFKLDVHLNFDVHIFAKINACINSLIAVLLIAAFIAVKRKKYLLHKRLMISSLGLSIIFLISYIAHHLLAGETKFGDANFDGSLSAEEIAQVGTMRIIYLIILLSHIFLAAIILPFILFTAYRGLTADYIAHKKIARYTFPLWLYVAITGPVIYLMISPYYQ
jgi:putative membrane protein